MVVLLDSEIDMCVNYWRRVGFASSGRVAVKAPVACRMYQATQAWLYS